MGIIPMSVCLTGELTRVNGIELFVIQDIDKNFKFEKGSSDRSKKKGDNYGLSPTEDVFLFSPNVFS